MSEPITAGPGVPTEEGGTELDRVDTAGVDVASIDAQIVVRRRFDVVDVELDGDVVLYDQRESASHVLNGTAGLVWQLLDGSACLGELAGDLAEAYGAELAVVRDDVVAVARQFGRQGLLEGVNAAGKAREKELHGPAPGGTEPTTFQSLSVRLGEPRFGSDQMDEEAGG